VYVNWKTDLPVMLQESFEVSDRVVVFAGEEEKLQDLKFEVKI
jgi:prolyl-tRNA editing enzyme YbaK/EbsC (Cys-tRNA(Pro) deacylase)